LPFIDFETIPEYQGAAPETDPLRTYFPEAGVLVSRAVGENPVGIAIKAGNNDEHHNHNDVGSFIAISKGTPFICDPGAEVYTRDTFSDKRYLSHVHNSFGHGVPVVAGQLQGTGREFAGKVLSTEFTPGRDSIVIDMAGAYSVPELLSLTRSLEFDRVSGTITITDSVEFTEPKDFSTALITIGTVEFKPDGFTVVDGEAEAALEVLTDGCQVIYNQEELHADWKTHFQGGGFPRRFGIECTEPVLKASITCVIDLSIAE